MGVQKRLKLIEVGDDETVFRERSLPSSSSDKRPPVVFAVGYDRVVYGDHGPYIEFSKSQICWEAWPHYFEKTKRNPYFHEYYTEASHSSWSSNDRRPVLMLYAQLRTVADRPWAPGAGPDTHAGRPNGYADYRPGRFYVPADEALIIAG